METRALQRVTARNAHTWPSALPSSCITMHQTAWQLLCDLLECGCGAVLYACRQAAAGTSSNGAQQEQLQQQVATLNKRITALKHENEHLQSEVSRLTAFTAALQASAAEAAAAAKHEAATAHAAGKPGHQGTSQSGAAARRAGLTPLKPGASRLASTAKRTESIGMPGTPTDAPGGAGSGSNRAGRGPAARGFSSDGGASLISTPTGTLSGEAPRHAQSSRFSAAGGGSSAGARQSDGGEGAGEDAAQQGVGVSYASQHWEEVKLLQGKLDAIR